MELPVYQAPTVAFTKFNRLVAKGYGNEEKQHSNTHTSTERPLIKTLGGSVHIVTSCIHTDIRGIIIMWWQGV